jgi:hypothetical protein
MIISALHGLLPPPRRITGERAFIGIERSSARIIKETPWEDHVEITWDHVSYEHVKEEIKDYKSLSLAPRAFRPASPLPRRTISLRLKETEHEELASYQSVAPQPSITPHGELLEEDFDLSDFEDHRDPELFEMHQTYRALEEQIDQFSDGGEPRLDERKGAPSLDLRVEPSFDDPLDDEASRAEASPMFFEDPFKSLDEIEFDQGRLMGDFSWTEGTPTNVFDDEDPTPTDVFEDADGHSSSSSRAPQPHPLDDDAPTQSRLSDAERRRDQGREKGIISRFFRRG